MKFLFNGKTRFEFGICCQLNVKHWIVFQTSKWNNRNSQNLQATKKIIFLVKQVIQWKICQLDYACFCMIYFNLETLKYFLEKHIHPPLPKVMMMNRFCAMVYWGKAFSLISRREHCQRFLLIQICNTPWVEFKIT